MKARKRIPLLGQMMPGLARKIGASVKLEPVWGIIGQITYKSGVRRYLRYSSLDINGAAASEIAKDKDYATYFIRGLGYPIVTGKAFHSPEWAKAIGSNQSTDEALAYARKLGFPVITKPNSGSQGAGVCLSYDEKEFASDLADIFKKDRVALVQKFVVGKDYRVVVFDGKVVAAYERVPLSVTGDGRTNLDGLLKRKHQELVESNRDIHIRMSDSRIARKMLHAGLSLESVIPRGERVQLLDNANLSTGGDCIDVTADIHPEFKRISINLTKEMGLRLCGVDLMVKGDIRQKPKKYWVLEINASPGFDHYVKSGQRQKNVVEGLYLSILKEMERE